MTEKPFPTNQWADWARDFELIQDHLVALATRRRIHRTHLKAIEGCEITDGTGIVHRWMLDNYAESMMIGLRRLVDKRSDAFSLVKLLEKLQRNYSTITIDRFRFLCEKMDPARPEILARALFGRFSTNGRYMNPQKVAADIAKLLAANEELLTYVNSVIAHRSLRPRDDTTEILTDELTWADLDRLFDDIVKLFNKYLALVQPGVYVDVDPVLPAGYEQAFVRMVSRDVG